MNCVDGSTMIGSVDWPWQAYCITAKDVFCWFMFVDLLTCDVFSFQNNKDHLALFHEMQIGWFQILLRLIFPEKTFAKYFLDSISIASRNLCDGIFGRMPEATNPSVRRLLLASCWHGFFATRMTLGGFSIHSDPTCQVLHLDNERWLAPCVAGTGMAMAFASSSGSLIRARCHRNILKLISNRCPWQLHVSTLILASQAFMECQMQRSIAP